MHGRQVLVLVAKVVLAELASGVTKRLKKVGDARIFSLHPQRSAWDPHLAQTGAKYALPRNERGAPRRAALLAVVVRKDHAFIGDPIDEIGRASCRERV